MSIQMNTFYTQHWLNYVNTCTTTHLSSVFIINFLRSPKNFGGAYSRRLVRPSVRPSVCQSVRTTHSCPAHNFVIWSGISKLFNRNDHHVETTCRAQNLGSYLEGQGHSATLNQNRVRPITLLLAVGFKKYYTEIIIIIIIIITLFNEGNI